METESTRSPVQNGFDFYKSQERSSGSSTFSALWHAHYRLAGEQVKLRHDVEVTRLKDKLDQKSLFGTVKGFCFGALGAVVVVLGLLNMLVALLSAN